ncbi:MAG: PCMD domain-containing protein [Vicingaceae bacterium]
MKFLSKVGLYALIILAFSCSKEEETPTSPLPAKGCFDQRTYTEQLPNLDFEDWSSPLESAGRYEEPCGGVWATGNGGTVLDDSKVTTVKTTDAQNGMFGAKMTTVLAFGLVSGGSIYAGKFKLNLADPAKSAKQGVPFDLRPLSFNGFFKYQPVNGDSANIIVLLTRFNNMTNKRDTVAFNQLPTYDLTNVYTEFKIDLNYNYPSGNLDPDTIVVNFTSSKGAEFFKGEVGSTLYIDNCKFTY